MTNSAILVRVFCCFYCLATILLLILPLSGASSPPVDEQYKRFFAQYEQAGWAESLLNKIGLTTQAVGRSFALVAGVSEYPNFKKDQQLDPAKEDIDKMVNFLKNMEIFDEIVVLRNDQMTIKNLRYFLMIYFPEQLAKFPKSRFFFAYSGHGFTQENDGYLLTRNARTLSDQENSVGMREVRLWVDKSVAKAYQSLVLINACHSGAFLARGYGDNDRLPPSLPGAHAITASGADEKAWSDPQIGPASIFFEKFWVGVKGAADTYPQGGGDGVVTVDELITYLKNEVHITNPNQNPIPADISKDGSKGGMYFVNRNHRVSREMKRALNEGAVPYGDGNRLLVRSVIPCTVKIDGGNEVSLDTGAIQTFSVSAGDHIVQAYATGKTPWEEIVKVEAESQKVVHITFTEGLPGGSPSDGENKSGAGNRKPDEHFITILVDENLGGTQFQVESWDSLEQVVELTDNQPVAENYNYNGNLMRGLSYTFRVALGKYLIRAPGQENSYRCVIEKKSVILLYDEKRKSNSFVVLIPLTIYVPTQAPVDVYSNLPSGYVIIDKFTMAEMMNLKQKYIKEREKALPQPLGVSDAAEFIDTADALFPLDRHEILVTPGRYKVRVFLTEKDVLVTDDPVTLDFRQ